MRALKSITFLINKTIPVVFIGSIVKPASEYNILGQTQIFVSNIKFEFVRQSNILFRFTNICNKDMYVTLRASGWLSPSNRTPSCPTSAPVGSPLRWSFILTI